MPVGSNYFLQLMPEDSSRMLSVSVLVTAVWATSLVAADSGCDVFYSCTPKKQCEPYQEDLSTLKGKAEIKYQPETLF